MGWLRHLRRFPWPLWALPALLLVASAPLWLHWWEPGMFLALNHAFLVLPAGFWTGLSLLGNGWGVLGLTAPLLVLAPRLMWAWLCAAPFAAVFARTGKAWLESPRPAAVVDNTQMHIVGEVMHNVSMPSGHTTTAFAVACALFFAMDASARRRYGYLVLLLALGTGLSRIAVGAHWPGDVAVGAALGLLSGLLGNALLQMLPERWFHLDSMALRLVALLVALAPYFLVTEALDFAENQLLQDVLAGVAGLSVLVFAMRSAKALRAS
jgi:membrane-associated phospholipid phosphatase